MISKYYTTAVGQWLNGSPLLCKMASGKNYSNALYKVLSYRSASSQTSL